jgi:exopolysaccharide biosynthesis predicted pyruvyltransferase EpsI
MNTTAGADGGSAIRLVERLGRSFSDTLDQLLPAGSEVVLLDYPSHRNIGDHLIWLGQIAYLSRREDISVHYLSDRFGYSHGALARALPADGVVLLSGGGNFGDIYPQVQRAREAVIEHFPAHRFIQLPQTVSFRGSESARPTAATLGRHPDFTLLARDRVSLEFAEAELPCKSELCVDAAFMLGPRPRVSPDPELILWLARRDGESANAPSRLPADLEVADWTDLDHDQRAWTNAYRRSRVWATGLAELQARGVPLGSLGVRLTHAFDRTSWTHANAGFRWMSRGRALVTDRLHGHIMALLLGVPHVLLDNAHSKVKNFYETWTHTATGVHWADTPEQALTVARSLVAAR